MLLVSVCLSISAPIWLYVSHNVLPHLIGLPPFHILLSISSHSQVALLDETSNILTVSLRGLKSNVKYAEDYVKLSVAQSTNTFPTAKVINTTTSSHPF